MLRLFFKNTKNKYHILRRHFFYESLKSRSLVEVSGIDSKIFIQGLITNDIYGLGNSHGSIYSLFLNAKGRVLFDVILYGNIKNSSDDQLFIDCDTGVVDKLIKHLHMYKLRKKVQVNRVENAAMFAVMPEHESELLEALKSSNMHNDKLVYFGSDPRIKSWVLRCIGIDQSVSSILSHLKPAPPNCYLISRIRQGICEGVDDFHVGSTLPLEYNGDIMSGISFSKGCYIGQELTARTHHTGVVRKRLMSVQFDKSMFPRLQQLAAQGRRIDLCDLKGATVGQLHTINEAGLGLAVVRLSCLQADRTLDNGDRVFVPVVPRGTDCQVVIRAPNWWPSDVVLPHNPRE